MTTWKLLLVLAVLALPFGYVVADMGTGVDEPPPRPAIVLPAQGSTDTTPEPGRATRKPDPRPSPTRSDDRCDDDPRGDAADDAADDADDRADDRAGEDGDDDDEVEIVRPCPDDVGDDDDHDDDRGERDD